MSNKPLNRDTPIRPVTAYGVNDSLNTLISYVINCFENNISPVLTGCEQIWDYLHADDAARAFRLLGQCSTNGVYPIGSGIGLPLKSYIEKIYELMNPNVPLVFGGKLYAENQVMHLEADISDLKRDTDFEPQISFEEGITRILRSNR